jgi:hypothetical protein
MICPADFDGTDIPWKKKNQGLSPRAPMMYNEMIIISSYLLLSPPSSTAHHGLQLSSSASPKKASIITWQVSLHQLQAITPVKFCRL